jgi:hypothetical protein
MKRILNGMLEVKKNKATEERCEERDEKGM